MPSPEPFPDLGMTGEDRPSRASFQRLRYNGERDLWLDGDEQVDVIRHHFYGSYFIPLLAADVQQGSFGCLRYAVGEHLAAAFSRPYEVIPC